MAHPLCSPTWSTPKHLRAQPRTGFLGKLSAALAFVLPAFLLSGCGSGGNPPTAAVKACVKPDAPTTQVPILFTSDAALGALDSFYLAINSITLTDSCGNSVAAYTPQTQNTTVGISSIELRHVNGVSEPLTIAALPAADYTSATVTYSDVGIGFVYPDDSHFNLSEVQTNPIAATADLPSPITIDGSGTALTLDALVTAPIVIGPIGSVGDSTVTVTPAFQLTGFKPAAAPTNDRNGKVNIRGLVNSVSADSFNMNNSTTGTFDISISPQTVYQGIGSLAALPINAPANVDVALQPDGSLVATRIEVENTATGGSWVGPLVITYPTGAYQEIIPQLWQEANNPAGPYIASDAFPFQFQFTGNTFFQRSGSSIDLTDLPFAPSFASFADVALGQGLSIDWSAQQLSGNEPQTEAITAVLVPRTFSGTISAITPADKYTAYTLTLAANDMMQTVNHTASITAYTNVGTQLEDGPLSVGDLVNMHGLVYSDNGVLRLVADQVRLQQTPN